MTRVADRLRGELIQRARVDATLALRIAVPAAEGVALRLFESRPDADRFYWEQPSADRALCGGGGPGRLGRPAGAPGVPARSKF